MEEVAIIADPEGEGYYFAKGVYDYLKSKEGEEFSVCLIDLEVKNFKDGEFKVRVAENIRGKRCFLIHDSNKEPSRWFVELSFVLDAIKFSSSSELVVVFPYTRFARQDRKDESRVGVNAKVLADMISNYATRGMTVDLHVPQMQSYFKIPFDNLYSSPSLINYLIKNHKDMLKDLVIVSPDLGGGGRAESLVKRLAEKGIQTEVAFGHKTREKANEVAKSIIIGDVENKNCLIIDDMIDTGGTMIKTAESLKNKGAKKVFCYATHGMFNAGFEGFEVFDKVLVSDTLKQEENEKLEIVSLVNLFGEAIYRTIVGESLSVLFDSKLNNQISLDIYDKL